MNAPLFEQSVLRYLTERLLVLDDLAMDVVEAASVQILIHVSFFGNYFFRLSVACNV